MEKQIINWGILGLGKIANKFTQDLALVKDCRLFAVGSRTIEKAESFARQYKVTDYGNYQDLIANPNIDAIYIATPHSHHYDNSFAAIDSGKPVLCEKPLTISFSQTQKLVEFAKTKQVLLMEALWTRFLPSYKFVKETIEEEKLGKVISIEADFGFKAEYNSQHRLMNKSLAGGSLLDIGIYPVFLAVDILGLPKGIDAYATFFDTGADSSVQMTFSYNLGVEANLTCTLLEKTATTATIICERGEIFMNSRFHEPTTVEIRTNKELSTHNFPADGFGYNYEIEHFNELIRLGKRESPLMSLDKSLELSKVLDKVKDKIGLDYSYDIS